MVSYCCLLIGRGRDFLRAVGEPLDLLKAFRPHLRWLLSGGIPLRPSTDHEKHTIRPFWNRIRRISFIVTCNTSCKIHFHWPGACKCSWLVQCNSPQEDDTLPKCNGNTAKLLKFTLFECTRNLEPSRKGNFKTPINSKKLPQRKSGDCVRSFALLLTHWVRIWSRDL